MLARQLHGVGGVNGSQSTYREARRAAASRSHRLSSAAMDAVAWGTIALAIGTFALAGVTAWAGWQTKSAAQAAKKEAEAATRTVQEIRRDRDLSWQPYLVTGSTTVAAQVTTTAINIGRGPAVNCLYAARSKNGWMRTGVFALAPGQEKAMLILDHGDPPLPVALFEYQGLELDQVDMVRALFCQDVVGDKLFRFIAGRAGHDVWRVGEPAPQWAQTLVRLEPGLQPNRADQEMT